MKEHPETPCAVKLLFELNATRLCHALIEKNQFFIGNKFQELDVIY